MNHNPVGWFEIYVDDLARAKSFYETVMGVSLESLPSPEDDGGPPVEMLAFPMRDDAAGAGGAIVKMDGVSPGGGGTLVYFSCEDCAAEAGRVEAAGGKLHRPKFSIQPYGFMALAEDTEGNMLGLHSKA